MLTVTRNLISQWGFKEVAWRARQRVRVVSRAWRGIDRRLVKDYLASHEVRKLQIGCGKHPLEGWLNTDFEPLPGVMLLDATQTFPLASETFDYVYSEHMIEHVPYQGGAVMLRECHRVLKPGGVLRISTPDLAFLIGIYNEPELAIHRRYIEHAIKKYAPHAPSPAPAFVVNNFVRNWDHQFIYDEATLRRALVDAGFADVRRCTINHSTQAALTGRENVSRMPAGFLELESLIVEATKAGAVE